MITIIIYLFDTIGTRHLNKYRVLECVYGVGLREAPGKCITQTNGRPTKETKLARLIELLVAKI